ncbi:MAG TPA: adenosylmethionine decarboxylase [Leucothrix sp.]|nr:adenosylmethionine decarboxylase [Leucothrix sp.]
MKQSNWPSFIDDSLLADGTNGCSSHADGCSLHADGSLLKKPSSDASLDLFTEKDGLCFAGTHIIVDCWGASRLNDLNHIEQALQDAVDIAGATLLHIHLHHFTPNGGVSGVAVLAESHISIHTWPERNYAALDIFMCGDTQPEKAIAIFKEAFQTSNIMISKHLRGVVPSDNTTFTNNPENNLRINNAKTP